MREPLSHSVFTEMAQKKPTTTSPFAFEMAEGKEPQGGSLEDKKAVDREVSKTSARSVQAEDPMPFKRANLQKSPSMVATGTRGSVRAVDNMMKLQASAQPVVSLEGEGMEPLMEDNICLGLRVVRGPDWCWNSEDGGPGHLGIVLSYDAKRMTAQVLWEKSCQAHSHYRYGSRHGKVAELLVFRMDKGPLPPLTPGRRNSQEFYGSKNQTIFILDWDDTLFPTTYVRDELQLTWTKTLQEQRLPSRQKAEVSSKLAVCANRVVELVRQASKAGKVVLVTLARKPWVSDSCRNFFPSVGTLIRELNVPVVYAQEGVQVDYNKVQMASDGEVERFWSTMKARAIARECAEFYSQYEGQSWKNVISIGDSDFERLGTMLATQDYMVQAGIPRSTDKAVEVDGHMYKVRTKTFKMVDQPSVDELITQIGMLRTWLPLMVKLDSNFDVNLNNADDPTVLRRITSVLRGEDKPSSAS